MTLTRTSIDRESKNDDSWKFQLYWERSEKNPNHFSDKYRTLGLHVEKSLGVPEDSSSQEKVWEEAVFREQAQAEEAMVPRLLGELFQMVIADPGGFSEWWLPSGYVEIAVENGHS